MKIKKLLFSDDYVAYEDTIKQMRKLAKMIKEVT